VRAVVPLAVWAEVVRGPPSRAVLADLPEPALPAGLVPQQADTVQAQASRQGDRGGGAVLVRVHDTPLKPAATGRRPAEADWLMMLMTGSCGQRTLPLGALPGTGYLWVIKSTPSLAVMQGSDVSPHGHNQ